MGGGVRSGGGGSGRSMRTDLRAPSRPSALAAVAALAEDDDPRHRAAAEAEARGLEQSQRRAERREDGGHAEEEIEEEAEGYARDGGALGDDEIEAEGNGGSLGAAFIVPPQLGRQQEQSRSPLSSPPPPPDASLAFAAVTATNDSERVAAMEGLPATGDGPVTVTATPTSSPESVLQRVAEACRQAGVELVSKGVCVRHGFVECCCAAMLGALACTRAGGWAWRK